MKYIIIDKTRQPADTHIGQIAPVPQTKGTYDFFVDTLKFVPYLHTNKYGALSLCLLNNDTSDANKQYIADNSLEKLERQPVFKLLRIIIDGEQMQVQLKNGQTTSFPINVDGVDTAIYWNKILKGIGVSIECIGSIRGATESEATIAIKENRLADINEQISSVVLSLKEGINSVDFNQVDVMLTWECWEVSAGMTSLAFKPAYVITKGNRKVFTGDITRGVISVNK